MEFSWMMNHCLKRSSLPEDKINILFFVCNKYIPDDYKKYINSGDEEEFVKRADAIYRDLKELNLSDELYELLFLQAISFRCEYDDSSAIKLRDGLFKLIEKTFFDLATLDNIINVPVGEIGGTSFDQATSGYVSFVKTVGPKVKELLTCIEKEQSYAVLKKQKEIIDLLITEGISKGLDDQGLQNELNKRFTPFSQLINLRFYKRIVANPVLSGESNVNNLSEPRLIKLYSREAAALQRVLSTKMLDYYHKTNCILYPYDINTNLYLIKNKHHKLAIYALKYDNLLKMRLHRPNLSLNWNDPDFWVRILDPNMTFQKGKEANYVIKGMEEEHSYKVVTACKFPYMFGHKPIIIPEEHLDEAIFKILCGNDNNQLTIDLPAQLEQIGLDFYNIGLDKLIAVDTFNGSLYFKDPTLIDDLTIDPPTAGNPKLLRTLKQLQEKEGVSRKRSLATINANVKKKSKTETILPKPYSYNKRPRSYAGSDDRPDASDRRLPYKD